MYSFLTNDVSRFLFSVAQSPVWSIVDFMAGDVYAVSTIMMQQSFVVRTRSCSLFKEILDVFVMLSSKQLGRTKCQYHAR